MRARRREPGAHFVQGSKPLAVLDADDAARALSVALLGLSYYREGNPHMARAARRVVREVLLDHRL